MDETARTGELRRKLEKDPGSRLFAQLAEELRKEGKHEEAISVARKGLEKNPNYPSARLTLARALLDSGRPGEARPELEQIVKASPDNILASRLLGDVLDQLGETAQALAQFEKTLRLSPGDKAVTEKIAELKGRAAGASAGPSAPVKPSAPIAAAPPAPPAPPAALPSVFDAPAQPLPSVFGDAPAAAPLPSVFDEPPGAVTLAPSVPSPSPNPTLPPSPTTRALDRDLASGTFSPGALNAADIQKHFDEVAAEGSGLPIGTDADATIAFGGQYAAAPAVDLPPTLPPLPAPPPTPATFALAAPQGFPALEMPREDPDLASQTLPLNSLTLADLYLQQGLKAEASAVLAQVLKEEPENLQAKTKLAAVSSEISQPPAAAAPPEPAAFSVPPVVSFLPAPPAVALAPEKALLTRGEIRERTVLSLKAFAAAAEREALAQKATERGVF